jgi:exodeoxyribonuclease V gamma subunit
LHSDAAVDGLVLLRASRLESLLGPLQVLLKETQPENPLLPQTVIAAHPGMKQWLTGALAARAGARRIVANLEVLLPSAWLDALSRQLLGERAVALPQYRRGNLRWTLHAMLDDPGRYGIVDPRVVTYLGSAGSADERALRRFQLADRLARVFSRYLVYRCDWLDAWEAGKHAFATARNDDAALRMLEQQCLAPLWNALASRLGEHRGTLVKALAAAVDSPGAALPPLHVFGLSHLPPAELSVLRAYARSAPVFLYVPDPCREYWGGLYPARGDGRWRLPDIDAWQDFGKDERARLENPDALDWREQDHPLLARWGRLGQHFFAALADDKVREDIRHWQDEGTASPRGRLQRLQESIRRLEPGLMAEDADAPDAITDASLRIHACHTRQRELEVLRDALLDAIEHERVRPGDIVVMAPDIQAYLPLIPAVFGEPGSARERLLPYHLADVAVARSHPLFTVFETLLGIGASRVTAPEVVDLLAVAEVRRALALDDDSADTLVEWLAHSRVAWALDGAHKAALSLPARVEYSFAWAMDRMLAGYLMADVPGAADPEAVVFPDGTELLPMAGIEGPGAAALGSLDRLLRELQGWRDVAQTEQKASDWAGELRERVDALIRIDPADTDARAALSAMHRAIANLAIEPACNGVDPVLRLSVVGELLQDALAAAPERQRFLMGGITFCGMVPQRAIPFAVVCVLGLDEGAFPRNPSDGGIDLMARIRRVGDRDVPADDRYLFLETVMSARKRLHLSYIGQGVRDGKRRNPAAPLAELMAELDLHAGIAADADHDRKRRPWQVQHPLQPFDARYFDGTRGELYSYSHALAGMRGDGRNPLPRLRDGTLPKAEPLPEPLPLGSLEGFFKDPAKALLKEHLQLSLDALDDDERLPEDEPMDGIAQIHAVARRVFLQHVLLHKCADRAWTWDRSPPAWVRQGGLLPLGAAAESAWTNEAEAVEALWREADASARFDQRGASGGRAVRVEVSLIDPADAVAVNDASARISGIVRNVFPLRGFEHGVQVVFAYPKSSDEETRLKAPKRLDFKDRVPSFLHWALLRLQYAGSDAPAPVRLTMLADGEPDLAARVNAWDVDYCAADSATRAELEADLRRRLRALVELWRKGREGLSRFYPKAGWEAVKARPEDTAVANAVRGAWVRDFGEFAGERDYAPGHTWLLEGDLVFGDPQTDPGSHALRALVQDARQVDALIMLGGAVTDASPDAQEQTA